MRGDRRIRTFLVPILIMIFCFFSLPGEAANINISPSLTLEGEWDSNIFDSSTDETSDFIFRTRPALTLYLEAFHTTAAITVGIEFERYADNSQLDDTSDTSNFDLTVSDPFRITPNFSLLPSVSYVESRDSNRRNFYSQSESPSPELPPSEAIVTPRAKERNYRASLLATYLLTPNVDLGIGGGATKRDIVDDVSGSGGEDSKTYTGDASAVYRISPRLSSGVFFNTSHNTFETSPDAQVYTGGLSARYLLSQFYTLDMRAGVSYLTEDADETGQSSDDWAPYGRVYLEYVWQYFEANLLGSYEYAGGGSFGTVTKRGTVRLALTNQFSEGWWWDLSGYYQNNSPPGEADEDGIDTVEGTAGIRYAAAEWASLHLTGRIFRQRSDGSGDGDIDGESVFLGITLSKLYRLY